MSCRFLSARLFAPRLLRRVAGCGLVAALAGGIPAFGQAADSLETIGRRFESYSRRTPVEKLFMHLDRPCYVSGETMWFKLYAVEGTTQRPLAVSTVAYVEVLDAQQVPVLQAQVALQHATGQGSFELPATLASGRYTVRAYTSWMKNFGPEYYFRSFVTIVDTRTPLGSLAARPAGKPDAQFFPEGGYLVQGLMSKVGFKLTDAAGRGVAAEGRVLDPAGNTVAQFSTLRFGMGSFAFAPTQAGAGYKAVIQLPNQQPITYPLPAVREQGYVLRLADAGPEQLRVTVQTRGLADAPVYLLGHARQQVAVAAVGQLRAGEAVFTVPKSQLAAGVSHFTLFNSQRQPVCERLFFRPPAATLALQARSDKPYYATREKAVLHLATAASQPANLSVAVYQLDSLSAAAGPDITSYLWLSADIKGWVEHPEFYCSPHPDAAQAADNLMLTQGWSRFAWADVLSSRPAPLAYPPELHGHLVRGRVTDSRTGAPVPDVPVYLAAPSRRVRLYNALSRADGSLLFEVPDWVGPQQLVAQTNPRPDSLARIEIFSPYSRQYAAPAPPPELSERLMASMLRRHVQTQVQQQFDHSPPVHYLPPATDSVAFYGKPRERYFLDQYTRFKVLEEVIREYVPGVLLRTRKDGYYLLVPDYNTDRTVMENPLVLLDGVPIFNTNRLMAFDPLKLQRLDVVTNRYVVGPVVHNGIVSFTTYQGDLADFPLDPRTLLQDYEGLQGRRTFYAPSYDTPAAAQSRLPDFRNLLYWNPAVTGPAADLSFYTSDQTGTYLVVVQGLSADGLTGSTSFRFEVKAAP